MAEKMIAISANKWQGQKKNDRIEHAKYFPGEGSSSCTYFEGKLDGRGKIEGNAPGERAQEEARHTAAA